MLAQVQELLQLMLTRITTILWVNNIIADDPEVDVVLEWGQDNGKNFNYDSKINT